jgi:putative ABC transport system permease protein
MVFATVAVAVAFTTGAFGFSEQLGRILAPSEGIESFVGFPEGTVVVTADDGGLATVTALDEALLGRIRAVSGVASATGSYDQPVAFDVRERRQPDRPGLLRGVVLSSTWDEARWRVVDGRPPVGPFEVALDRNGLVVADTPLGGEADLEVPIGTVEVRVVGVVAPVLMSERPPDGAADAVPVAPLTPGRIPLGDAHVVLDPATAPVVLDAEGRVDRITVIPDVSTAPEDLEAALEEVLPAGVRVDSVTSPAAASQQTVGTIEGGIRSATLAYAGVTLLVSVLVVVNVLSVIVAQRTRELGLLRAIGAHRRTLVRLVLTESLFVGGAAAVVGGALGVVLAYAGARVVRVAGVDVAFAVTPAMVAVALVVGVGVTVLGALLPAMRAGAVSPLAALSDTRAGADRPTRGPLALALVVAGFGSAAVALSTSLPARTTVLVAGAGLVVGFVGMALLSRWVVVPLAGLVGTALGRTGVSARLGVGNARRQPSRTAGAASTLMVALALVAAVATVGSSARRTIDEQVRDRGNADLYLERRGLVRVSTTALESYLAGAPDGIIAEVAEVMALDGSVVGPDGTESGGVVAGLGRAARVLDLGVVDGSVDDGTRGVLASVRVADRLGVDVGDEVTVRSTSGREVRLPVAATYTNTAIVGGLVVDRASAAAVLADGTFELAAVDLADGVGPGRVMRGFRRVAGTFHEVKVDTPEQYTALRLTVADTALRVVGVLLAGSLGVGFLGLAGTLALSTAERRRELVMLRAVGASRAQIRLLVWIEATFIGVVAVVVGVATGLALGWVGTGAAPESVIGSPIVPWGQLAVVAAVAVLIAWLVSLGVARRAARLPPSEAGRI